MKVEKCPLCHKEPFLASRWNTKPWVYFCMNQKCSYKIGHYAYTKIGACIKWNRWARREAKRIAKEGEPK